MLEHENIKLIVKGLRFTWDDDKNALNIQKHNINFVAASAVFFDGDAVIDFNSIDNNTGEERFDIIGMASEKHLYVVYVERVTTDDKDVIRIISARHATLKEVKRYYNGA